MKKILIVGDSYTYGTGCDDRPEYFDSKQNKWIPTAPTYPLPPPSNQCWASLLQNALPQYEVINLGFPGHDASTITMSALAYYNSNEIDLVIYAGTGDNRSRIATDQFNAVDLTPCSWVMSHCDLRPGVKKDYIAAQQAFMTYLYHPKVFAENSIINIYAIHAFANAINSKILWNLLFWDESFKDSKLDVLKQNQFLSIIEFIRVMKDKDNGRSLNSDYLSPDGHANTIGHKAYFEEYLLSKVKNTLGIN